jgi:hypothetical protein
MTDEEKRRIATLVHKSKAAKEFVKHLNRGASSVKFKKYDRER